MSEEESEHKFNELLAKRFESKPWWDKQMKDADVRSMELQSEGWYY